MFTALLAVKAVYVLQAFLFILFFTKSLEVRHIKKVLMSDPIYQGQTYESCAFVEDEWVGAARTVIGLMWIWSIMFYGQIRLAIIATTVGSWHFHPDNMPPVCQGVATSLTKSAGTLSLAALILAIVDRIKKSLTFRWYHHCLTCGMTLPLHCVACILLWCIETCIKMLTKFTTILHVFTGLDFFASAKKTFGLMTRHFENGFVTHAASTSVISLGAFVFSFAITFTAWAWIDAEYGWSSMPTDGEGAVIMWLWIFFMFGSIWNPELAIAFIMLLATLLEQFKAGGQQNWVAPICATFVGAIAMIFMKYMGGVILDTIDVCFVCWAIDKDNDVDLSESEFASLVMELPGVKKEQYAGQLQMQQQQQQQQMTMPMPMGGAVQGFAVDQNGNPVQQMGNPSQIQPNAQVQQGYAPQQHVDEKTAAPAYN